MHGQPNLISPSMSTEYGASDKYAQQDGLEQAAFRDGYWLSIVVSWLGLKRFMMPGGLE